MGKGVKQGRPSSMLLSVLAADPLLRWVQASLSERIDTTPAYADDFCFGLPNMFTSLGPALHKLALLEQIEGLKLNFRKCQILWVGGLGITRMRAIGSLKGDFKLLQVVGCAKDLG
eukprot:7690252-Pyramimonas_sp.AAC.1